MSEASNSSKISIEDARMKQSNQPEPKKIHFRRILLEIKKAESFSMQKIYKQ